MHEAPPGDKRSAAELLVCHGPSCSLGHDGALPGDAGDRLTGVAVVKIGACLGLCPVGPNAILRRGAIEVTESSQQISKEDSILCGIADPEELAQMAVQSLQAEEPPRLIKGRNTPKRLSR